ncbi:hypothetical protein CRENBAI_003315 [Crenichthys baileyi]|uniref:Uncharacterized protein n=1 Tax=Crenichthys baileyi TaxID=28760 RepID=A0AAV9R5K4_9TELE
MEFVSTTTVFVCRLCAVLGLAVLFAFSFFFSFWVDGAGFLTCFLILRTAGFLRSGGPGKAPSPVFPPGGSQGKTLRLFIPKSFFKGRGNSKLTLFCSGPSHYPKPIPLEGRLQYHCGGSSSCSHLPRNQPFICPQEADVNAFFQTLRQRFPLHLFSVTLIQEHFVLEVDASDTGTGGGSGPHSPIDDPAQSGFSWSNLCLLIPESRFKESGNSET